MLLNFLENIEGISDKEYQERIWIRGEGPECDAFDETCCDFFEGLDEDIIDNYKEYGITENQRKLLVPFRDKFRIFSNKNYNPELFINSPEWAEIMKMAKDVLTAFHYKQ
jgi:hypothetical protein